MPESSKLPELHFNYGPVEMALAMIYAATEDDKRRKAFRARINYFQRAKVLGGDVEVGNGKQNAYSIVQIGRWLACLELTELGLSPTTAGELCSNRSSGTRRRRLCPIRGRTTSSCALAASTS